MKDENEPEGYLFGKIPYYKKQPMTLGEWVNIFITVSVIALAREGYLSWW